MSNAPHRRLTAGGAALAATISAAALLTATPVHADPCKGGGGGFGCHLGGTKPGTGSPGGGSNNSGGGGGGGDYEPPPPEGGDTNQDYFGGDAPEEPALTTPQIAAMAADNADLPTPTVHTAPSDKTYVRVRTGLWVDGYEEVQTKPITVQGRTVQATATPKSVTWQLGETTVTCNNGGSKNGTTCGHTFSRSSAGQPGGAYRITATTTWSISWTCAGACGGETAGNLPDMSMSSAPTPLVVGEIQTNTGQ